MEKLILLIRASYNSLNWKTSPPTYVVETFSREHGASTSQPGYLASGVQNIFGGKMNLVEANGVSFFGGQIYHENCTNCNNKFKELLFSIKKILLIIHIS